MLVISFFYNKLEDYYICSGIVIDDNVSLIVNKEELNNIIDNNKTMIERNIFTYKVLKINELEDINSSFNEVILEFDKIPKHLFINNNIINMKIITNKTTFFEYLIKIAKGEWHIKEISKDELKKIDGGGISLLGVAGIVAGAVFLIGVIDGYVRPKKCNE